MKFFAGLGAILLVIILVALIALPIFFNATPVGVAMKNTWFHKVQVADDNTNYDTLKEVENTCRAMIASYNADKLMFEQYKDSEKEEKQSWAEQAKMRANKTATTYNQYILKNKYVWDNNVPEDINFELEIIK